MSRIKWAYNVWRRLRQRAVCPAITFGSMFWRPPSAPHLKPLVNGCLPFSLSHESGFWQRVGTIVVVAPAPQTMLHTFGIKGVDEISYYLRQRESGSVKPFFFCKFSQNNLKYSPNSDT